MDELVSKIVGLGVVGIVFVIIASTITLYGGALVVATLTFLGGPLGLYGGVAAVAILALISSAIAQYGIDNVFKAVLKGYKDKGTSKKELIDIITKIPSILISRAKKTHFKDMVNKWY